VVVCKNRESFESAVGVGGVMERMGSWGGGQKRKVTKKKVRVWWWCWCPRPPSVGLAHGACSLPAIGSTF